MTQPNPSPNYFDMEMLAAALRKHTDDLSLYSGFLLNTLSAALPGEMVEVRREGKIKARLSGRSEPAVLAVAVRLGSHRYELERTEFGRPVTALIRHESGGVVMSSKVVSIDEWSRAMATDLGTVAGANAAAAEILARLTTL